MSRFVKTACFWGYPRPGEERDRGSGSFLRARLLDFSDRRRVFGFLSHCWFPGRACPGNRVVPQAGNPAEVCILSILKKSLALSFRYDTHRFAATAKILIQIVAPLIQIVALHRSWNRRHRHALHR